MTTVLVTGGTGVLGSHLVPLLVSSGHDVRVLSRRDNPPLPSAGASAVRGDLDTGAGLDDAVRGVDIIAHLASGTDGFPTYRAAKRTDVDGTAKLLAAVKAGAGTPLVVYTSIVGVDVVPLGYYRAKLETEQLLEASGLPITILRSTQWHTLAWEFCGTATRSPVVPAPMGFKMQLLDPSEVAQRVATLVGSTAGGHVTELGGPEVLEFGDVARKYCAATGKRRIFAPFPLPGKLGRAFRAGGNLTPRHADGRITWDEFLAARIASAI